MPTLQQLKDDAGVEYRNALRQIVSEIDALMACNGYREALTYGSGGTLTAKTMPNGQEYSDNDPTVWVGPRAHKIRELATAALKYF